MGKVANEIQTVNADKQTGMPAIAAMLDSQKDKIQLACRGISADRAIQVAKLVASGTKLAICVPHTVLAAVIRATSLGLDLTPSSCECYMIPRRNGKNKDNSERWECTFQLGYQGLRKMVLRNKDIDVTAFETRLVYEHERFEVSYTPMLNLVHVPNFKVKGENSRGELIGGYGYGCIGRGQPFITYMSRDEILYLRSRGKGEQPAWVTDEEQMWHKTLCIRLSKLFPKSQEISEAVEEDHRNWGADFGDRGRASGNAGLKNALGIAKPAAIEAEFEEGLSDQDMDEMASEKP